MRLKINIEFRKILSQFKQKDICRFIHDMQFEFFFTCFNLFILNMSLNKR
jgi:hypothetical protein